MIYSSTSKPLVKTSSTSGPSAICRAFATAATVAASRDRDVYYRAGGRSGRLPEGLWEGGTHSPFVDDLRALSTCRMGAA